MALNGFSGASGIAYGLNLRGVPKKGPARPLAALAAPASDDDDDDTPAGDVAAANATLQAVQRRLRESAQARAQEGCARQRGQEDEGGAAVQHRAHAVAVAL